MYIGKIHSRGARTPELGSAGMGTCEQHVPECQLKAYIKLQIIQSPGAQELVALYTLTCESKTRSINASNLAFADKAVPQNSNFAHS